MDSGADGAIHAGLEELVSQSLQREWPRAGGAVLRVGRLLVDMGYKPEVVAAVKHKAGGETIAMPDGKALTLYKKQADGSWKIAYDCFNANVPPAK